jgi:hypothetical protein
VRDSNIKFGRKGGGVQNWVLFVVFCFYGLGISGTGHLFVAEERKEGWDGSGSGWLALLVESIYLVHFIGVLISSVVGFVAVLFGRLLLCCAVYQH